eukprot:4144812-Pleurochrysis_carterae.AAC.1
MPRTRPWCICALWRPAHTARISRTPPLRARELPASQAAATTARVPQIAATRPGRAGRRSRSGSLSPMGSPPLLPPSPGPL